MANVTIQRIDERFHYVVPLNGDECRTLAWIAARYDTAGILWAHTEEDDDGEGAMLRLPESEAWRYRDALATENGNPDQLVPACVGGTLAEKLEELYDAIV